MKFFCSDCGCHFPDEFEETLKCTFWERRGLANLDPKRKKEIWDFVNSFNTDKFAEETGISINIDLFGQRYTINEFERDVPNYKDWNDETRKEFQKDWFKFVGKLTNKEKDQILLSVFYRTNEKWNERTKKRKS